MKTSNEARDELRDLLDEAEGLLAPAESEGRDLTADENKQHNDLLKRIDAQGEIIARAERAEQARAGLRDGSVRLEAGTSFGAQVMTRRDPFEALDDVALRSSATPELVSRARTAIEQVRGNTDNGRSLLTRLVEDHDPVKARAAAEYAIATGSPHYRSAFDKWLRHPQTAHQVWTREEADAWRAAQLSRAALSTSNAGALLPQQLDPTVILTSNGSSNPYRQVARVEQGFTNQWEGATSAGITAEWVGEGSEFSDNTPSIASKTVTAHKAGAYAFASYEVLGDSNFAEQLPRLMMDAKDNLEADAFAVGSGSGAPTGIVTAVAAVTASRVDPQTGGAFGIADVYSTIEAVPPRHRGRATWVANFDTYNLIRGFDSAGGSSFWTDLNGDTPARLIGRPTVESSEMDSAVTTGSNLIVAADMSEYLIYDRVGMELVVEPVVNGDNGRPTGQAGFVAWWRVGADSLNPNSARVLQL
jgi:HK97 family phage major capsid protein